MARWRPLSGCPPQDALERRTAIAVDCGTPPRRRPDGGRNQLARTESLHELVIDAQGQQRCWPHSHEPAGVRTPAQFERERQRHRAKRTEQEPVRRDLGGLLFDQPRELAFEMFAADDRHGGLEQRRFGGGVDVELAHGGDERKPGTNVASGADVTADFLPATHGAGPLLQRDYWAVLTDCALTPTAVMDYVKKHFCSLPPPALITFTAPQGLAPNAVVDIAIKPGQQCAVSVVHESPQSVTLATLAAHPEAGRITFGCYRNAERDVIFHIRSRARSTTALKRLGFLAIGDAMQTNTWTDFIRNTAAAIDASIAGAIHAETQPVDELPEDDEPMHAPTFAAVGD